MDWSQIIGLLAPALASLLAQGLKKVMKVNNGLAVVVVIVIGGIIALIGVGPVPESSWVDTVCNAGFISGVASLIFALLKKRS